MSTQFQNVINVKPNFIVSDLLCTNDAANRFNRPIQSRELLSTMSAANREMSIEQTASDALEEIKIELVEEKDSEGVLNLLRTFFFKDEPMNTYLDLGICKELEDYSIKTLPEKCSFKAVNSKGEIVGVYINGIVKRPLPGETAHSYANSCKHEKFRKILNLMEYIDEKFDIFDLYPSIDCFLDGRILSVDSSYRGYGIAGRLTEKSLEFAKEKNIPLMSVLCSSHYSARVCEKLNFKNVYTLNFVDYFVDGVNPILPKEPHKSVRILVKEIV